LYATREVEVVDARLVGREGKHLKLNLKSPFDFAQGRQNSMAKLEAIGFGMGELFKQLKPHQSVDVAYTVELDEWNGNRRLVLKLKDLNL